MTKDFEELLACLLRHGVRFVVVGAYAVAHHAKPRYTKDLDLFVDSAEEAWQSRVDGQYGSQATPFIGHAALVKNKLASGRAQDLADVETLTGIHR